MKYLEWKKVERVYTSYKCGYLGKYGAFTIQWDGITNKHDNAKYKLCCNLNGTKEYLGNFKSEELAMERAEGVLLVWMDNSGLTVKEG